MAGTGRWIAAGGTLAALAWAAAEVPKTESPAELERARAAAQTLKGELMKSLTAALTEGGPPQGVRVCSEIAPGIAARLSKDGMIVRRVTTKPRNPANAPNGWERAMLDTLAAAHARGEAVTELVETPEEVLPRGATGAPKRVLVYMTPLTVAAPCLQCHGDPAQIDPAVKAALAEKYPKDQATGYKVGDFRGAVAVRIERP